MYISAKNEAQITESFVVKNDLSIPDAPTSELYYRVEVRNGIAYINGNEYLITPTNIDRVIVDDLNGVTWYSIEGIKMNNKNKRKGIYIINKDGKTEKVILPL